MTTPAELTKATDLAIRGKSLMARASKSVVQASRVFDNVEATLDKFDANVAVVDQREKNLSAQLATLGNVAEALDSTFQSDGKNGANPPEKPAVTTALGAVSAKPTETAHLPQAQSGGPQVPGPGDA